MKIQILLPSLAVAGVLAACSTNSNHASRPAPAAQPPAILAGRNADSPAPPTGSPETRELRALLEHSLVTGRNAHAFMELFARSDSQFQEFIERALVNNEYQVGPPAGLSATRGPVPDLAPDPRLQK